MNPTVEYMSSCLNQAEPHRLSRLAEACLADDPDLVVTRDPEVGVVVAQVREPIAEERFILGDVMACQVEVHRRGSYGWAMRLGDDRRATLAAAVLVAEYAAGGPRAAEIVDLCELTVSEREQARTEEWERLAPSIVEFEEVL